MTSKRDDPSRSSRSVRATYRLVSTNRLPLDARLSTNSCSTRRRPGKLSNVRSSRNSSSRNVAGSPAAVRARAKNASVASKAPRAPAGAPSLTGNGAVADHGAQKTFGRRRRALDVDGLRRGAAEPIAQLLQQSRAAAAASADEHRNAGRRRVECGNDAARQSATRGQHARASA